MGYPAEFRPRMQARTRALRTLEPLAFQALEGAVADVWAVHGEAGGGGHYIAPDPRIVIFLDDQPPPMVLRAGSPEAAPIVAQAFFMPADLPMWARMQSPARMTHLDIHFEHAALERRLAAGRLRVDLARPRLLASNTSLVALGRMAAAEIRSPRAGRMLLDGLLTAVLAELFAAGPVVTGPSRHEATGRLAPWQMAAVRRLVEENMARPVSVADMARAARLSESWFAHAFRAEVGQPPHRWLAGLRLERAAQMIREGARPLAEVAQMTGFADQSHLSRRFRAHFGMTPTDWRRAQGRRSEQAEAGSFKTGREIWS